MPPTGDNLSIVKANRLALVCAIALSVLLSVALAACSPGLSLTVRGTVSDAANSAPLADVVVSAGGVTARSDAQGNYVLAEAPRNSTVTLALDGYQAGPALLTPGSLLARSAVLNARLQPVALDGVVTDGSSGQRLSGAQVSVGGATVTTAQDGAFHFAPVRSKAPVSISADGYETTNLAYGGGATLAVALTMKRVPVTVVDEADGSPVAGAAVSMNGQPLAGGQGGVVLPGPKQRAAIAAQAPGYAPATVSYSGQPSLTLKLAANTLSGSAREQGSGKALAGITITLQDTTGARSTSSNNGGDFAFRRVLPGTVLAAAGPEHEGAVITYTGQPSVSFSLREDSVRGVVRNQDTGKPMAGITVTLQQAGSGRSARSDDSGAFQFAHAPLGAVLAAAAPGHSPQAITYTGQASIELGLRPNPTPTATPVAVATPPVITLPKDSNPVTTAVLPKQALADNVKGIYIPFYLLTVPERVRELISFAERSGMNALVIDIKADDGYLAYSSKVPLARDIKAQYAGSMISLDEVLKLAKQRGMYTIARMVVFKDNLLAESRPALAVTNQRSGGLWDDCGNGTTYWVDPFRKEVLDYNASIAEEAGKLGFDEIQFDYIRFPPACISGARMADAVFAVTPTLETRVGAIEAFLAETQKRLRPLGVATSVDTFGWTLFREDDAFIGQSMESIAKYVDYISPMIYPSTWEAGALGIDYVPAHPYDIVYQGIKHGIERLKAAYPGVKLRPWLQDFDDYQSRRLAYGVKELDAQRQGNADAGGAGWMLWNAGGVYTEETP